MESLPWPAVGAGAGWVAFFTLAFLVLRALVKGDLIPRSTHEREMDAKEHDATEWRTEGRIKDQVIGVDLSQIKATTEETGKTLHHFIAGMQEARKRPKQEGD